MANRQKWSDSDIDTMRRLFKTKKTTAEIASVLGRTKQAVHVKAAKLGFKKNHSCRIDLTPEEQRWLKANYPHMATIVCALKLGISQRTCVRRARELGVYKTEQFMKEAQAHTSKRAKESHLRNGTYNPKGVIPVNLLKGSTHRFKPGHQQ